MTDAEFMHYAFKGSEPAIAFVKAIHDVAHVWDDLVDKDKQVADLEVGRAFFTALVGIPANPFFRQYSDSLLPVMAASCFNYQIANDFEKSGDREKQIIAHAIRYGVADVLLHVAFIVGGWDWVAEVGPELRARSQKDILSHYLTEIEGKSS